MYCVEKVAWRLVLRFVERILKEFWEFCEEGHIVEGSLSAFLYVFSFLLAFVFYVRDASSVVFVAAILMGVIFMIFEL